MPEPMTFPHADRFRAYLELRRRSPRTISEYEADLDRFWSECHRAPASVTRADLEAFAARGLAAGAAVVTVRRRVWAVSTYFRCLRRAGLVAVDPAEDLDLPAAPQRVPDHLSAQEIERLLAVDPGQDFNLTRALLEAELLYSTGARISELVGLRPQDLDLPAGSASVIGKRNKERLVPLTAPAIARLAAWLTAYPCEKEARILRSERGGPVEDDAVRRDLIRLGQAAGLSRRVYPHLFRHTMATHLLDAGVDLETIRDILGHGSTETTRIYAHASFSRIHQAMKAHPRNAPTQPTA